MAYVYRHIRLDKNEPFYIGVGEDKPQNIGKYKRAYNRNSRNAVWKSIINSTNYEVEILMEDLTYEEAYEKEIEFINLYGRLDLGTGTLCNLKEGGLPIINYTKEIREKLSNCLKERHKKEGYTKKMVETRIKNYGKKIVQKTRDGEVVKIWDYQGQIIPELIKENKNLKINRINIVHCLNGKRLTAGGYRWEYLENPILFKKKEKVFKERGPRWSSRKIVQKTLSGEVLKVWDYYLQIQNRTGIQVSNIRKCINGERVQAGGYKWEYFEK